MSLLILEGNKTQNKNFKRLADRYGSLLNMFEKARNFLKNMTSKNKIIKEEVNTLTNRIEEINSEVASVSTFAEKNIDALGRKVDDLSETLSTYGSLPPTPWRPDEFDSPSK